MRSLFLPLLGIFLPATIVHAYDYVVHERRQADRSNWHPVAELDKKLVLPVRIALTQQNVELADSFLMNVSDPNSPHYGKWWTATDVEDMFAPTQDAEDTVVSWLTNSGIPTKKLLRSASRGWLAFNATVEDMERLVKANYSVFKSTSSGDNVVLSEQYSLPVEVSKVIDFVTPTVYFDNELLHGLNATSPITVSDFVPDLPPGKRVVSPDQIYMPVATSNTAKSGAKVAGVPRCDLSTTLECLRLQYNIPTDNITHPNSSLAVVQFGSLSFRQADLDLFFRAYQPESYGRTPAVVGFNGATIQTVNSSIDMNGEANLDLEYTMGLTYPMTVTNYQLNRGLNDMLAAFDSSYCQYLSPVYDGIDPTTAKNIDCGNRAPANVISISYAADEVDHPASYQERQCIEFLKLGLQGVTVVAASNDFGVAGKWNQCLSPINGRANATDSGYFNPTSPSNCPYVTAVGGSMIPPNGTYLSREIAFTMQYTSNSLSSGGGFSNLFPVPDYQSSAVQKYMTKQQAYLSGFSKQFNSSGTSRGIPDISVNAANYLTAVVSKFWKSSGTSASAPTFGAMIARVNDARLRAGKTTVGFVNPTLYANPWVFNDIVDGSNWGCGREGFRATDGWDPVTGLGSPDYVRLHDLFMGLP